jgi:hypothetical protein
MNGAEQDSDRARALVRARLNETGLKASSNDAPKKEKHSDEAQ